MDNEKNKQQNDLINDIDNINDVNNDIIKENENDKNNKPDKINSNTNINKKDNVDDKTKKENLFKYLNIKNLLNDLDRMGIEKPFKTIAIYYFIFAVILVCIALLLRLQIPYVIILGLCELFIVPLCIKNHYQKGYEDKRFSEVGQYIEQMLYSFKDSKKVLKSLHDIEPMFKNSEMGDAIKEMEIDIEKQGLEYAMKHFEAKYDCQKIHQMHKFMYESETIGGNHKKSVDILLKDKEAWVERTLAFQKEKRNKKTQCIASIVASFIICVIMEKVLPSTIDISQNIVVQITTMLLSIIDLILYYIVDKRCCSSILNTLKTRKDSEIKRYYEYVINYDSKREFIKGLKMQIFPLAIIAVGIVLNIIPIIVIGMLFCLWFLFNYKITYKSRLKAIKDEISIQFPRWLMQMALLVQSNSVQVALYKSIPEAATVLKPELIKLNNKLRDNPTSVDPYLEFMDYFKMPEITASMKMFYAISSGAGSDVERQINDIIKRNNVMLDKAEKLAFDNALGGMYALFLAPQLSGGFKMLIDMVIFFMMFMGSMNALTGI